MDCSGPPINLTPLTPVMPHPSMCEGTTWASHDDRDAPDFRDFQLYGLGASWSLTGPSAIHPYMLTNTQPAFACSETTFSERLQDFHSWLISLTYTDVTRRTTRLIKYNVGHNWNDATASASAPPTPAYAAKTTHCIKQLDRDAGK